jgi:hypothetical protein
MIIMRVLGAFLMSLVISSPRRATCKEKNRNQDKSQIFFLHLSLRKSYFESILEGYGNNVNFRVRARGNSFHAMNPMKNLSPIECLFGD